MVGVVIVVVVIVVVVVVVVVVTRVVVVIEPVVVMVVVVDQGMGSISKNSVTTVTYLSEHKHTVRTHTNRE